MSHLLKTKSFCWWLLFILVAGNETGNWKTKFPTSTETVDCNATCKILIQVLMYVVEHLQKFWNKLKIGEIYKKCNVKIVSRIRCNIKCSLKTWKKLNWLYTVLSNRWHSLSHWQQTRTRNNVAGHHFNLTFSGKPPTFIFSLSERCNIFAPPTLIFSPLCQGM